MKILVTGAAGFIGSHLIAQLLDAGHSVSAMVRYPSTASDQSKKRQGQIDALGAKFKDKLYVFRCEDVTALPGALKKNASEVCVHLAGRSWVRESIGWPELYEDANYRNTVGLVEALRVNGCRRILFASTVMVYGKDAPLPYEEEQLGCAPASPYGAAKLACEILLNSYHALHKLETVNLRLFSVYGPHLRPDTVPYLIASAILKGRPFTIYGDGSSMRDYVEIQDVLRAIQSALTGNESHNALNIGSGFGTPLTDLIQLIEKAFNKKAELVYKPAILGELTVAIPDISLAMEKLKWEPQVSIETGIQRLAEWIRSPDARFMSA